MRWVSTWLLGGLLVSSVAVGQEAPLILDWGVLDTTSVESRQQFQRVRRETKPATVQRLSSRGTAPWLVQFNGLIREEWKTAMEESGAEIRGYMPENGFMVLATPSQIAAIGAMPDVVYVGEFLPEYKRAKAVRLQWAKGTEEILEYNVWLYRPEDRVRIARAIAELKGAQVTLIEEMPGRALVRVILPTSHVEQITGWGEVEWVEPYLKPQLWNDISIRTNMMGVTNVWSVLGLTGAGQTIAVCDTGLDTGNTGTLHRDFTNRVTGFGWNNGSYKVGNSWADTDSHGTHVSGSVLGNGTMSAGLYRGVAYEANLIMQGAQANLDGIPANLNTLFKQAFDNGARIHSDSWGYSDNGAYHSDSLELDQFVWSNKTMLVLVAAGNQGIDANGDGIVDLDSIGSPATAKNCLSIGAAENYRDINSTWGGSWPDDYPAAPIRTDKISMPATGGIQGMAAFSSRGPCDDGRIKPDIVAPGTFIISTRSRMATDTGWGVAPNTNYLYMGGTSMATPLTAGAAALARQWVQGPGGIANPSAALLKALLISGARNMAPGQYGTGGTQEIPNARPSNVQGWGHVDLYNTLAPAAGQFLALYDTDSLSTGQNNTFELTLAQASSDKFILVLAYSDYWGTVGSGKQLVNDLDIRVQKPSGGYVYPNGRTSADRTNNVEMIEFIPDEAGTYIVTVTAYHVPSGGSQPYALVIRGPQLTSYLPPAAPEVVWASQTNITSFTAAWTEVADAESYRLDVATNNAFSGGGGGGGQLLAEGFASATPSGWTFSGVGTYSTAPYVGTLLSGTYSIKFDGTGDWGTTPTFGTGATNLQFWSYGNGTGTASTFTISGLVNSAWARIDTVSIASGGGTYNVPLDPATTKLGFYFTKNGYNCALDDVIVQAGGSAASSYVPGYSNVTVSGASQEVSGLSANKEYFFRVRTVNGNGTSGNSPTGSVTTLSDGSGTPPTVNSIPPQTATVGVDFTYEVSATEPNGDPFTFNCSSTVDGNTWDFDTDDGFFYFLPTSAQMGQNVFAFTATDKDGTSSPVAMTVTVSAAAATVSFGQARVYGVEGGSSVTLPVVLSSAADATVQVAISGTALPGGVDFSVPTTTLVFSASGPASLDLELTILDDALAEGPESARLQLNPVSGAALGSVPQAVFFIRDNDAFSIVAANLTSGDLHQYEGPGNRILQALCPDVVLIQEFLMTNGTTYADWVLENFGPGFYYFVESTSGDDATAIPNGIVSRWPIDASGEWSDDANVYNRDFAWATIGVPGPRKLHAVSVHFLTTGTAEREAQARNLTNYVANAGWNPEDYLVVGGDLNTSVRTESAIVVLTNSIVSDAKKPKDQNGDWDTNGGRTSPYDYVLPGPALHARHKAVSMYGHTFNDGMVFDTRLTWAGGVPPPALTTDSGASGMQHMGVVKVFELETSLEPPTGLAATAASRSQIDLVWTPNAAADEVVVVWNTDGNFTAPSGTPPAVGASFAGGYVLYKGTATSTSHNGLDGCSPYYYRAWSHANGVYSSAANASASTEGPPAPGLPWASETNNLSFVAEWEEMPGADSYRLDVSESASFGSGAGTSYTVNFDGSGETKTAYTYSLVSLGGKNWGLTEALIGDSSSDWKNGVRSARMRGYAASAMTLLEDLPGGLSSLAFNYRRYGTDAQVDWKAEYSTDGGLTWTQIGSAFTAPASDVVQSFSEAVNVAGNVRVRIVRATDDENASSNYRLNIDDIVISSLAGSYVDGYENLEVASGTSQDVTDLKADTTYYFRVRAVERTCTSGSSPAGQVTTLSVAGPGIVLSSDSLDPFSTLVGSPSTAQSFTVAGANLTGDITVTPPPGFEVSTSSGSDYGATVALTPSAGTVDETDVYVRLTGAAKGSFSGVVEATSPGAIKRTKAVSGTVSGPEITLSGSLAAFSTTHGTPSTAQSFTVAGANLTDDITVTAPSGYQVSLSSGSGYADSVGLTESEGTVSETTVYVRLTGAATGTYNGNISATSTDADTKTLAASGVVTSAGNVFTKITSLAEMTDGSYVIVNSGDGFAMNSGNAGSYFTHTAVTPDNGVITNPDAALVWTLTTSGGDTTIRSESTSKYVTYMGTANAAYASDTVGSTGLWNFTYASGVFSCANKAASTRILQYNASSPRFACYTTAQQKLLLYKKSAATPTITLSGTLNAFSTTYGAASSAQSFKVAGVNLTANIALSAPSGFQVSTTEGSGYANSVELTQSGGAVAETTIYVRLAGAATGTYNGNISATSTDATTKTLAVSGTVGLLAPTGLGAEGETDGRFTALWNAVSGATGYLLDVSEYETFSEPGENATDLFFSEYLEGSSNNKAIEIYNGTGSPVDLSDYTVYLYSNGSATPSSTLALSGTLAHGAVYVIANASANSTILALANITHAVANYNGDDALSLWKESTSSYVDIFGRIGEDPGTVWVDGSHQTAEQTLVRKSSVSGGITANPSSGFPTLASEWDTYSQDMTTYLGSHTFAGGSTPSFVGNYEDYEVESGTSQLVEGLDPETTYYFRVRAVDGTVTSDDSDTGSATTLGDMNPTILLSTAEFASFEGVAGAPSDPQTFTVAGQNLSTFIVVTAPSGFEVSQNAADYDDTALLEGDGGTVEETTLHVRLTGEALGAFSGNISASSTDAETKTKAVEGNVGLAAPVATSASGILTAGFVANWAPVTGATGYRLDVSTEEFFSLGGGGLFISEVADPFDAANAKFVELYNASDAAIDFSTGTWYIWRQANGSTWANMKLTGTVQPDGTYVLAYDLTYDSTFNKSADQYSSAVVSGNGDDGYFLVQGGTAETMGTIVDAYGVVDQDGTGYAWEYLDKHAVRNATIAGPNATWTASEWTIPGTTVNAADMTPGAHVCSGGATPSFLDGYANRSVSGTSQAVSELSPNTRYYYRARATADAVTSGNSSTESVWTLAQTPLQPTITTNNGTIWILINDDGNPASTQYKIRRLDANTYLTASATWQEEAVWQTRAEWNPDGTPADTGLPAIQARSGSPYAFEITAKNGGGVETEPTPTRVVLFYFTVGEQDGLVVIRWRTASEANTVGFWVERWDGSRWVRINSSVIYAAGEDGLGAAYSLVDAGAAAGGTYTYRLVEVETDGASQIYGPYERTASALRLQNPITVEENGILIRWLGRPDERYTILRSTNLLEGLAGFRVLVSGLPADPEGNEFLDEDAPGCGIYLIQVDED